MENTGKTGNPSIGELIDIAFEELKKSGSGTPKLDALILLENVLKKESALPAGISKSWISAHPEFIPGTETIQDFFHSLDRRKTGLPIAYITGKKFFWKYEFEVNTNVLIPKPDTELLVERTGEIIQKFFPEKTKTDGDILLLDMCTGSGCVAVSLKADFPFLSVTAADISQAALKVAKINAEKILQEMQKNAPPFRRQISFIQCDLREGIPAAGQKAAAGWDIITANPPYVPTETTLELLSDGRNEPRLALDGGKDGLALIEPLVYNCAETLAPGGFLLTETGEYNADLTAEYFQKAGFIDIFIHRDLAGQKRLVEGRISGGKTI